MGQIPVLETVEPREIPFKVYVMSYNGLSGGYIETVNKKSKFPCNHLIYSNALL